MPHTLEKQAGPTISLLAGKPAPKEMLIDVARLEKEYFDLVRPSVPRLGSSHFKHYADQEYTQI